MLRELGWFWKNQSEQSVRLFHLDRQELGQAKGKLNMHSLVVQWEKILVEEILDYAYITKIKKSTML